MAHPDVGWLIFGTNETQQASAILVVVLFSQVEVSEIDVLAASPAPPPSAAVSAAALPSTTTSVQTVSGAPYLVCTPVAKSSFPSSKKVHPPSAFCFRLQPCTQRRRRWASQSAAK